MESQEEYSALLKIRGEQLQGHCPSLPRACSARHLMMVQTMSQMRFSKQEVVSRFSPVAARVKTAPSLVIDWEDWE